MLRTTVKEDIPVQKAFLAFIPALALVACVQPPHSAAGDVPMAQQLAEGRDIAMHQCSVCHGIDKEDALRADTPALKHVLANYDGSLLQEDFESGLKVGHPDMPHFVFGPLGADLLLIYLRDIQEDPTG